MILLSTIAVFLISCPSTVVERLEYNPKLPQNVVGPMVTCMFYAWGIQTFPGCSSTQPYAGSGIVGLLCGYLDDELVIAFLTVARRHVRYLCLLTYKVRSPRCYLEIQILKNAN